VESGGLLGALFKSGGWSGADGDTASDSLEKQLHDDKEDEDMAHHAKVGERRTWGGRDVAKGWLDDVC
jgi:hypothetical protein